MPRIGYFLNLQTPRTENPAFSGVFMSRTDFRILGLKAPENPNPQSPGLADYFDFEKSIVTFESQMQTLDFGKSHNRGFVTSGICDVNPVRCSKQDSRRIDL